MGERTLLFEGLLIRLCSAFDEIHKVTCDLPADHAGEHKASVYWEKDDGD